MYRRKKLNLSVKRDLQMWMLARIAAAVAVSAAISTTVLYVFTSRVIGDAFWDVHLEIRRVSDLLVPVLLSGAAASLLGGLLLALFLPQRVAGPVYRIERDLAEIRDGNRSKRVRLRKNDPLQDLAASINRTLDFLERQGEKTS